MLPVNVSRKPGPAPMHLDRGADGFQVCQVIKPFFARFQIDSSCVLCLGGSTIKK
jgi:hypothetical protein